MKTLEELLQELGCEGNAFDSTGEFTKAGEKAYDRLEHLLYDIERLTGKEVTPIIRELDKIMQRELLKFKNMDIKESKEYRLAKDWEMAVNSFSFNPERFAAAIPDMHPTLQQSLYRLIKACIKVMADETRHYDERNQASHEEAKRIMEYLNEHGRNIPLK